MRRYNLYAHANAHKNKGRAETGQILHDILITQLWKAGTERQQDILSPSTTLQIMRAGLDLEEAIQNEKVNFMHLAAI